MTDKSAIGRATDIADALDNFNIVDTHGVSPQSSNKSSNPAADLARTIEAEILPRLVLVHSNDAAPISHSNMGGEIHPEQLDEFVNLMIDRSGVSGREMVDAFIEDGVAPEVIYLDLLAPAARQMGAMWESDIRNFSEVTIGLCRLHEVLRHQSLIPDREHVFPAPNAPTILLSTVLEDQHVFGVIMVAEFFRKNGWQVICEPGASTEEILRITSRQNLDMIGLSVARSFEASTVSVVIEQIRTSSRNSDIKVILGGPLIERDPTFAGRVGADGGMVDAEAAPAAAKTLLATARIGC
ncbi:MAG: cobalamin-dependent protein [Pseudomonadota bacterium]